MQFAIAMLGVATFLLITGVIGHDTEMGQGGIALKVHGKVGPVPRLVLFTASGVALVLAVLSFVAVLPGTDSPPRRDGTFSPVSGPTSSVSAGNAGQRAGATFSLLVGIRPQLGQANENMTLSLGGQVIAEWSADQASPSKTFTLHVPAGGYHYTIQGRYSFYDATGNLQQRAATGSGQITILEGVRLGINYLGADRFQLAVLP